MAFTIQSASATIFSYISFPLRRLRPMIRFSIPLIPLNSLDSSSDTQRSRAIRRSTSRQRRDMSQFSLGSGTDSPNQEIRPSSSRGHHPQGRNILLVRHVHPEPAHLVEGQGPAHPVPEHLLLIGPGGARTPLDNIHQDIVLPIPVSIQANALRGLIVLYGLRLKYRGNNVLLAIRPGHRGYTHAGQEGRSLWGEGTP